MDTTTLMIAVGTGFLVLMGVVGLVAYQVLNRGVADDRLSIYAGSGAQQSSQKSAQVIESFETAVSKSKQGGRYARDLARADLKLRVVEFIGIKIAAALLGAVFAAYLGRGYPTYIPITALVGAAIFFFLPDMYVSQKASARIKSFNNQLGDTITMMANSLRGGYSFLQTLQMVAQEAPQPVADEFRRVVNEVGLGRSTEEALGNLMRRVPSDDLDLLITAVNIQHEVGGNLAQILDKIAHTIRERVRIKGEINTLTAQGRISGYVITGLPLALGGYITLVNPDYMAPMFEFGFPPQAWCCLPVTSLFMIVIGYIAIMKIVDIEV
ncbi:MAG: secretion system protein [Chloroflexaceae bacterium]|nr:secretion system protein [Chloroflexaceae bacterium]